MFMGRVYISTKSHILTARVYISIREPVHVDWDVAYFDREVYTLIGKVWILKKHGFYVHRGAAFSGGGFIF